MTDFQVSNFFKIVQNLQEFPFYFNDYQIDKAITTTKKVLLQIDNYIEEVAEKRKTRINTIFNELEMDKNRFNSFPTILDIAAKLKPWAFSIDDEIEQIEDLIEPAYNSVGINSALIDYTKVKRVEGKIYDITKHFFLHIWIDLSLEQEVGKESGFDLLEKIQRQYLVYSKKPDWLILTHLDIKQDDVSNAKVYIKNDDDIEHQILLKAKQIQPRLSLEFNLYPENRFIRLLPHDYLKFSSNH